MQMIQIEKGIPLPSPRGPKSPTICKWCNKRERQGGFKTCDECRAAVKALYLAKRAKGLCGWGGKCDKPAESGWSMCREHHERSNKGIRKLLDGRVAAGLCRRCGKPRFPDDTTWCLNCRPLHGLGPLPVTTKKIIRQFWRLDRIDERRAQAEYCLSLLGGREADIFALRHGLADGIDHTLQEISDRVGVTRERVRQIEERELYRLSDSGVAVDKLWPPYETQRPPRTTPLRRRQLSPEESAKRNRTRSITRAALQRGEIVPQPCEKCGEKAQGHHVNYDDPFALEWLCFKHHIKAHGKKLAPARKPKRIKRQWIASLPPPSNQYYSAQSIRTVLLADKPKLKTLAREIGISNDVVLKVLRGERVTTRILGKVLAYVEVLKQQAA